METLKSILRTAAGVMLGVVGLLVLWVVVVNVMDRAWVRHLDGRSVVTVSRHNPAPVFSAADTVLTVLPPHSTDTTFLAR